MSSLVSRFAKEDHAKTLMSYQKRMNNSQKKMLHRHRLLCRKLRNARRNAKLFGHSDGQHTKTSERVEQFQMKMFEAGIPADVIHAHYESFGTGIFNRF